MFTNFGVRFCAASARAHSIRAMPAARQGMLVLLLLHYALAEDIPKQTNYVTRRIDSCPAEGYFFKREMVKSTVPGPCFLCFCQDDNTAVCWQRDNKRCDVEHYHHHGVGKRDTRPRRSPAGFSDIFFRDATRDMFNKQSPEQCKPYESSFSEGCPPADWCIGCTVCDCDSNGRWDCHILSFCPEKDKPRPKRPKGHLRKKMYRRRDGIFIPPRETNPKKIHRRRYGKKLTVKATKKPTTTQKPSRYRRKNQKPPPFEVPRPPPTRRPIAKEVIKNQRRARYAKKHQKTETTERQLVKRKALQRVKRRLMTGSGRSPRPTPQTSPPPLPLNTILLPKTRSRSKTPPLSKTTPPPNMTPRPKTTPQPKTTPRPKTTPLPKTTLLPKTLALPKTLPLAPNSSRRAQLTEEDGKKILETFMSAYQKMVTKEIEQQLKPVKPKIRNKRSLVKKMKWQKHLSDTTGQRVNYNKSLALPGTKKQKKHVQFGSIDRQRNIRLKRDVATEQITTLNYSTFIDTGKNINFVENAIDLTTERPVITSMSMFKYYKYTLDKSTENATIIDTFDYANVEYTNKIGVDVDKNVTVKRSVNLLNKGEVVKGSQDTFLRIIVGGNNNGSHRESKKNTSTAQLNHTPTLKSNVEQNPIKTKKFPIEKAVDPRPVNVFMKNIPTNDVNMPTIADITILHLNSTKEHNRTAVTAKKITRKVMERAHGSLNRKYKLTKVVNTLKKTRLNRNTDEINAKTGSRRRGDFNKTADFKNLFKKLFNGFSKSNKTGRSRRHRFKVIKYLQKFFKKIFAKGKNKTNINFSTGSYSRLRPIDKHYVINNLCESFGPCHVTSKNRVKLFSKVENLNNQTYKMLSTIKVIKGLLRLVDFAKNDRDLKGVDIKQNTTNFESDIQKLHAILRGTYKQEEHVDKLTDTQKAQIDYIKSNTHEFIQSAGKFAKTLNDIIDLLSGSSEKQKRKRYMRNTNQNRIKVTDKLPFEKLKELLLKYDLLQNTFMKKMYKLLSNIDVYASASTTEKHDKTSKMKDGNLRNSSTSEAIKTYTNNIMMNLQKLKHLAEKLDSANSRRKRDLRDDDSMEYLLVLMEYLLKHSNAPRPAPVRDGIDMLIEAIKQAPPIKPIKKKVLDVTTFITTSTTTLRPLKRLNSSSEDSYSDLNKISEEDNLSSKGDYGKLRALEHSFDENIDDDDKDAYSRKNNDEKIEKTTRDVYSKDNIAAETTKLVEEETEAPIRDQDEPSIPVYTAPYDNNEKDGFNFEKHSNTKTISENPRSYEIFNADTEEEGISSTAKAGVTETESQTPLLYTTTHASETVATVPPESTTIKKMNKNKEYTVRHFQFDDNFMNQSNKKLKLDWLDETYEEEVKAQNKVTKTSSPVPVTSKVQTAIKHGNNKQETVDNASSMTKEIEEKKKNTAKAVILKKEMDLLNSLDYVTTKSEAEDSESKETPGDKYSDGFSSYFN